MLEIKNTINDTGILQWGVQHQLTLVRKNDAKNDQRYPDTFKLEHSDDDDLEEEIPLKVEPLTVHEVKRQRVSCSRAKGMKATVGVKMETETGSRNRKKRGSLTNRWSTERYMLAEERIFEILVAEGATSSNPISRQDLRNAARKFIGDTGLLDHLLKHIDGKVAPGGTNRFKRCFTANGTMKYWLESAELDRIRDEAGVMDPCWVPPIGFSLGGGASGVTAASKELEALKADMEKMKSDMQDLMSKKQDEILVMGGIHEALLRWKANTEQQMAEVLTSMKGLDGNFNEMLRWKTKVDQQLVEITDSLNGLHAPKGRTVNGSPAEEWEAWFGSSNLDKSQEDAVGPLVLVEQDVQDPCSAPPSQFSNGDNLSKGPICATELEQLKNEVAMIKRTIMVLVPKKQEEDQVNATPDSSITVSSKSDSDNSRVLLQEMLMDLFNWKDKTEQQLLEVSNTLYALRGVK